MTPDARRPCILIIGGGAGGLPLAIRLARMTGRGRRASVTLVDPSAAHLWRPRLHEVAVGLLLADRERASFADQARSHGFTFVLGAVAAIDTERRTARIAARNEENDASEPPPVCTLEFDVVVLAIGSSVDDFGTRGVPEHCFAIDTPDGAERLHDAVLAQAARVMTGERERLHVAIVGAGTTGVEYAADLRSASRRLESYRTLIDPTRIDVTLIEAGDRPLPTTAAGTARYASRLLEDQGVATRFRTKVTRVEAGRLHLDGGDMVEADILVWASGVRARALGITPAPRLERGGRMRVAPTLQLINEDGLVCDHVYAIGDCAACFCPGDEQPIGATAQAAFQQARLLAASLAGQLKGAPPRMFRFRNRGTLVSLGLGRAVGDVPAAGGSFRIAGLAAKLAYRALYRAHFVELFGWPRTIAMLLTARVRRSVTSPLKLFW